MAGFSSTGLVKKTVEECRAEIAAEMLAKISATLDLSADQPMGQAVAIFSQREAILWEVLETLANGIDPDAAEGSLLDVVCAITGTIRKLAKKSKVSVNCNVNDGATFTAGQIMLNVTGQPDARFVNTSAVGPFSPAGVYAIDFESVEYGPIVANAATLTTITSPVSGLNSATNPKDATLGNERETDADLRARRVEEIAARGASTVDAIRADLLNVAGVKQAFVFENVTLTTDADGLPGKAFEAVVFDGTTPEALDADIAQPVWDSHPSGAEMHGNTTANAVDATGTTRAVGFSRATVVAVYLDFVDVEVDPEEFPADGEQLIKDAVAAYALKKQNLGVDVIAVGMKAAAMTVPGVIDVPTLKLGAAPSPTGTSNVPISGRQIAFLDTSNMAVSAVDGTP